MLNEETLVAGAIATWKGNLERADKLFSGLDQSALESKSRPAGIAFFISGVIWLRLTTGCSSCSGLRNEYTRSSMQSS
jgi:hypothetical protein